MKRLHRPTSIRKLLAMAFAALTLAVVVLNWTYGRLPSLPAAQGSFVQVGKYRIHYLERAGTGTPVLLLHGLPGTANDFDAVTPLLPGHRTIAIDRPGYAYSGGGYTPFSRQLQVIDALIHTLGLGRPIVVGHSYGGTLALGLAERYPGDVGGLVLVDAAAAGLRLSSFDHAQAHLVKFLDLPVINTLSQLTFSQLLTTVSINQGDGQAFHPAPVASAHRERLKEIFSRHDTRDAFAGEQLGANDAIASVDRGLTSITAPAVVIQGESDQLVKPVYGRQLANRLPHALLDMLPGGHMAPFTHPAAIAFAVTRLAAVLARGETLQQVLRICPTPCSARGLGLLPG
jgi:pimeloyl-ACP methyl ester carboxylesterase